MLGWTGIGRYTTNLLRELERQDRFNSYVVLLRSRDREMYTPHHENFTTSIVDIDPLGLTSQRGLTSILRKLAPDLVHFTHFTVPRSCPFPFVMNVHDLTPLDFSNTFGGRAARLVYAGKQVAMRRVLASAVRRAHTVITASGFVAGQLVDRFDISRDKIRVIPDGVVALGTPGSLPPDLQRPFLLYVGNLHPHKNVGLVLEALVALRRRRPDLRLVIVSRDDARRPHLEREARRLGVDDATTFPTSVDDGGLAALYEAAEVFVYPSMSEGFGLPPLEAMAHGTVVVSSNAPSMPEVLGDAALYFDPLRPEDAAEKIDTVLERPGERERLRAAGRKQAAAYSWAATAEQTLAVYQSTGVDSLRPRRRN